MLFERCHTRNRKRSLKQNKEYFNFRSKIQLDHPEQEVSDLLAASLNEIRSSQSKPPPPPPLRSSSSRHASPATTQLTTRWVYHVTQWERRSASRCCTADVCLRQSLNQLYINQKTFSFFQCLHSVLAHDFLCLDHGHSVTVCFLLLQSSEMFHQCLDLIALNLQSCMM